MNKIELIEKIISVEKEMFLAVPTEGDCACKADISGFEFHRKVQFIVWDERTLQFYLEHIQEAWSKGQNLMTVKYARMESLIPKYSENQLIDTLVDRMVCWQSEMVKNYPAIMANGRPIEENGSDFRSFHKYLSCELETYSDAVLESLNAHQEKCEAAVKNLSIVSYDYMVRELGYGSLDLAEKKLQSKT